MFAWPWLAHLTLILALVPMKRMGSQPAGHSLLTWCLPDDFQNMALKECLSWWLSVLDIPFNFILKQFHPLPHPSLRPAFWSFFCFSHLEKKFGKRNTLPFPSTLLYQKHHADMNHARPQHWAESGEWRGASWAGGDSRRHSLQADGSQVGRLPGGTRSSQFVREIRCLCFNMLSPSLKMSASISKH